MTIGGKPLEVIAPDPSTVRIRFPSPFGPGVRVLDNLPILARHKLEPALRRLELQRGLGAHDAPDRDAGARAVRARVVPAGPDADARQKSALLAAR